MTKRNKTLKRALSLLMSLTLVASMLCTPAFAAEIDGSDGTQVSESAGPADATEAETADATDASGGSVEADGSIDGTADVADTDADDSEDTADDPSTEQAGPDAGQPDDNPEAGQAEGTDGTGAEQADPDVETADPDVETSGPDAETADPNAEKADPDAETADTNAETADPDAGTAGSDVETADPDVETAGPNAEGAGPDAGQPEDGAWDGMEDTKRPEATDDVTADVGTSDDKPDPDKDWSIFYDPDEDVYKVTFNIGSDAEATTQVIDLTKALELLNQYAAAGKQELEDAIAALDKPVMGEPEMEKPVAPGVPEDLEGNLDSAYQDILANVPRDGEGEPDQKFDYAGVIADKTGLDKDSEYVQAMADRMYDQAMVDWVMENWDTWAANKHPYASFGDPDTLLYYGCGIEVKWPEGTNNGTPVLSGSAPEFKVDTSSDEYKAYEAAMVEYNKALAELEAKYADDQAAYDAAVQALKDKFDRQIGADVLEPGDVKKFELFLTSDSKHTYKYQEGSFTLATPDWEQWSKTLKDLWENDPDAYRDRYQLSDGRWLIDPETLELNTDGIAGFDGQILPDEYVDNHDYYVTTRSEPIQAMFDAIGMDEYDKLSTTGSGYWASDINKFLASYPGSTNEERLNSYILSYYNTKDNTSYATIEELVKGNADARAQLTMTTTSGNKWLSIDGQNVKVDAHLETVKYDQFYKQLFSFAFGDRDDIDEILKGAHFNTDTNRWEYENDSWTDNGYQNALYYYMSHQEIWQQTDGYFKNLLAGGLTAEQATWASLMMALNIDGELTGNDWQDTEWPWYSSITLDRTDYNFHLTKTDEDGNVITTTPAEFQLWYVNESGQTVYLKQDFDADGEPIFTESLEPVYISTGDDGTFEGLYSLMKDKVYYLKETKAPDGFEVDPTVYVLGTGEIDSEYLEGIRNEAIDSLEKELAGLKGEDYIANEKALAEIEAKVKELMEADGMSTLDVAAYANELKAQLAGLKAEGMTLGELDEAIAGAVKDFEDAKAVLDEKGAALAAKRDAAAAEIDRLNAELDGVKAQFDDVKARYEAATDAATRNALIAEMESLRAQANGLTGNMAAVRAAYEADALHAEYAAAKAEAEGKKGAHDAYAGTLNSLLDSPAYKSLQTRLEALQSLKDAKDALDASENAAEIARIEKQLKIESDRLFKEIGKLQKDETTDWVGSLELDVYLENRKAIEEGTFDIPELPSMAGDVTVGDGIDTVVPDAGGFEFDVPTPEEPDDPDDPPPPPPTPEEPEEPDDDEPEDEIPEEPTPLDPGEPPEEDIPEEDVPLTDIPEEDIPEEDVPLTDIPEEDIPEEDIPEEDIPLSDIPQTGDESRMGLYGLMMAVSMMGLAVLGLTKKREN